MTWIVLSKITCFWYWCEQQAGKIWVRFGNGASSYWLDFLPAFFLRQYYRSLNRLIEVTGRTLYGQKIEK